MNAENEHDYFKLAEVRLDTPDKGTRKGAYLVVLQHNGAEHWVPKTLCELCGTSPSTITMEVEHWFAEKEGMNNE